MTAKTTVDFRVKLEPRIHDWIVMTAKMRKTTPARIVTDCVESQLDIMPRIETAIAAIEAAARDGDRIAVIRDWCVDAEMARAEADERSAALLEEKLAEAEATNSFLNAQVERLENEIAHLQAELARAGRAA